MVGLLTHLYATGNKILSSDSLLFVLNCNAVNICYVFFSILCLNNHTKSIRFLCFSLCAHILTLHFGLLIGTSSNIVKLRVIKIRKHCNYLCAKIGWYYCRPKAGWKLMVFVCLCVVVNLSYRTLTKKKNLSYRTKTCIIFRRFLELKQLPRVTNTDNSELWVTKCNFNTTTIKILETLATHSFQVDLTNFGKGFHQMTWTSLNLDQ